MGCIRKEEGVQGNRAACTYCLKRDVELGTASRTSNWLTLNFSSCPVATTKSFVGGSKFRMLA